MNYLAAPARIPISAEARGKLRRWRQQLAADYREIERVYQAIPSTTTLADFMRKRGLGRRRAFDRINTALCRHGARLMALRLEGKQPVAVWAVLKPDIAVRAPHRRPRRLESGTQGWAGGR
jgi:hypothetical protein